jgi:hypothetical protein
LLYFEIGALTSQLYASSAVLQMNKAIKKVWRYAALQWHNVKKIQKISELLPDLLWMNKLQYSAPCNPCVKKFPFHRRKRFDILKEINVQVGIL